MSSTNYSTLLSRIAPFITRAPAGVIEQQIARAAEDFFEESEIWTEEMASFNTVVDQAAYTVTPGYSNVRIKRLEKLVLGDSQYPYDVSLYDFGIDNRVVFDPAPTVVTGCVLTVVYVPNFDATAIESGLMTRWGGVLAEGATYLIKRDVGNVKNPNPWFDPSGAAFYKERFERGINKARMELIEQRKSNRSTTVKMRDWV